MGNRQIDLFASVTKAGQPEYFRLIVNGYDCTDSMPLTVAALKRERQRVPEQENPPAPAKPLPVSDYVTKDSPAAKAGAFYVQAMQHLAAGAAEIQEEDWAAYSDGAGWHLAPGTADAFETRVAFPLNRGAGMIVRHRCWIVRFFDSHIEIMYDATFQATFEPVRNSRGRAPSGSAMEG